MDYFQCTCKCSCIRSQFPLTVHRKGVFWGGNEHFKLSNDIGKDQIALLVLLIPHWHTHCIYMYFPKIKLFSEFHDFLLYTNQFIFQFFTKKMLRKIIITLYGFKIIIPDFFTYKMEWSSSYIHCHRLQFRSMIWHILQN